MILIAHSHRPIRLDERGMERKKKRFVMVLMNLPFFFPLSFPPSCREEFCKLVVPPKRPRGGSVCVPEHIWRHSKKKNMGLDDEMTHYIPLVPIKRRIVTCGGRGGEDTVCSFFFFSSPRNSSLDDAATERQMGNWANKVSRLKKCI